MFGIIEEYPILEKQYIIFQLQKKRNKITLKIRKLVCTKTIVLPLVCIYFIIIFQF